MQFRPFPNTIVAALAICNAVFAQDMASQTSSGFSGHSASPTTAITTTFGVVPEEYRGFTSLGFPLMDVPVPTALSGSIVTVNPSGTVVAIACPYTTASDTLPCDFLFNNASVTIRPSIQITHRVATVTYSDRTATLTEDASCSATYTALYCSYSAFAEGPAATTRVDVRNPRGRSDVPLTITAGLEKAMDIPPATETTGLGVPTVTRLFTDIPSAVGAATPAGDLVVALWLGFAALAGIAAAML